MGPRNDPGNQWDQWAAEFGVHSGEETGVSANEGSQAEAIDRGDMVRSNPGRGSGSGRTAPEGQRGKGSSGGARGGSTAGRTGGGGREGSARSARAEHGAKVEGTAHGGRGSAAQPHGKGVRIAIEEEKPGVSSSSPTSLGQFSDTPHPRGWTPPRKRIWPDFSHRQRKQTDWEALATELGLVPPEGPLPSAESPPSPSEGVPSVPSAELSGGFPESEKTEPAASPPHLASPSGIPEFTPSSSEPTSLPIWAELALPPCESLGEVTTGQGIPEGITGSTPPGEPTAGEPGGSLEPADQPLPPGAVLETHVEENQPTAEEAFSAEVSAPPLEFATVRAQVEPSSLDKAGEVTFAIPSDLVTAEADTAGVEGEGSREAASFSPDAGSLKKASDRGEEAWELEGEKGFTEELILPERSQAVEMYETPVASLPEERQEGPEKFHRGTFPPGKKSAEEESGTDKLHQAEVALASEPSPEGLLHMEEPRDDVPPAFRAWAELFGEGPPELITRQEEAAVRESLGVSPSSSQAELWQDWAEDSEESERWDTLKDLEDLEESPDWVSSTTTSWVEEARLLESSDLEQEVEEKIGQPAAKTEVEEPGSLGEEQPEAVSTGERAKRSKRRRGRRRRRPAERATSEESAGVALEAAEKESIPLAQEPEEDHLDTEAHDQEEEEGIIPSRAIPTWEETVGLIVAMNMENRARSHSHGGHSGHPRRPSRQ